GKPVEDSLRAVVERIALEVVVGAGLKTAKRARDFEVPAPPLVSVDLDREVASTGCDDNVGVRLGVVVRLTGTDVIAEVALQSHKVRRRRSVRACDLGLIPAPRCFRGGVRKQERER